MAIDLPPALPPEQGTVEALRAADIGLSYTLDFNQFTIRIIEGSVVDQPTAERAMQDATDLSTAVRAIARAAYVEGYPAAKLTYARQGDTIFLHIAPGAVEQIDVPAPINRYFDDLPTGVPRAHEIEPRRTLASLHADRAGRDYAMQIDDETLTVTERDTDRSRGRVYLEVGNPGNRFVGRHFLDVFVQGGTRFGGELTGFGRSALTGLNAPDEAEDYAEHLLSYSQVTEYGVFGFAAHGFTYDQTIVGTPIAADLLEGEISWLYPVYADFVSRATLSAKAERVNRETETRDTQTLFQRELYTSGEIALGYTRTWQLDGAAIEFEGNLAYKQGFGDDNEPLTVADLGYGLARPTLRGRYKRDGHTFSAELAGQITDVAVPEQQQWVLGGQESLYASLPGLAVGDSGALARIQWQPPTYPVWKLDIDLRSFIEYGATRFESEVAGRSTDVRSQADIGAEVEVRTPWGQELAIGAAHAFSTSNISQAAEDDADANYFFRVRQTFD